ncbi:MAG TPA: DeoR/GlpR family DNA-binding transcription regulator [Clostridia bacterium]|nr:DeoR/GlpR family DNA-binding transcription regulator [Clostridia bacterium]
MFAIERQNKIKEILFKQKRVDVFELSKLFSVTEVTIRRDLDKLQHEGFLIKTYGGAILNEELINTPSAIDLDEPSEEKKMIGKIAAQLIDDEDAVFLSAGSTSLEIVKNLDDKRITIVTNDLLIGYELRDQRGIKVMITGGDLIQSTSVLAGGLALQSLNGININKAFIGVKGVSFDSGYTVGNREEVMIIQAVARISSDIIIIADHTKFNKTTFAKLGDLTVATKVVTNKQVPSEYKRYYFEHGIKLYTAFEFE